MAINPTQHDISEESDYLEKQQSIKEIVLSHIKKISDLCCKEFTPGFWENKPQKIAGGIAMSKVYHQDTRKAYSNAVDFLSDIVYPLSDSKFKAFVDDLERKEPIDISADRKMEARRKLFKEINKMFERMNFFDTSDFAEE